MDQRLVRGLQHLGELLKPNVCEAILAKVELCKVRVVLHNFADDVNSLITQCHV